MYLYNGQTEEDFKKNVSNTASLRIKAVSTALELREEQVAKLNFALKGDLNRFFRELDDIRERTKGLNFNRQPDMQKAWDIIMPLYNKVHRGSIIDDTSLVEGVLSSTLDDAQKKAYEEIVKERKTKRFEAIVKASLADMQNILPLLATQRQKLLDLLLKMGPPATVSNGMEAYVGYSAISRLKKQAVEKILDKNQMVAFNKIMERYGRFGGIKWDQ